MPPKRHQPKSFAEMVDEVGAGKSADLGPHEPGVRDEGAWPQPIREREWVDGDGNRWHMRGVDLDAKQSRRLLNRPDVRVLHVYGVEPSEVSGAGRDALMDRIEQFFTGEAPAMSEFRLADFRDDQHRVMLVVQEYC